MASKNSNLEEPITAEHTKEPSYDLEASADSTISLDSETCSNLANSQLLSQNNPPAPVVPQDQVLVKVKEVEGREREVEHVLKQNNRLMRNMLETLQHNKSKNVEVRKANTGLLRRVAELERDLKQKTTDIHLISSNKNNSARMLKIDQAAAAVKDLRDQLYEKDRLIDRMKTKVEHDFKAMGDESTILRLQLKDSQTKIMETENRCGTLTNALEENQTIIDSANDESMKQQALVEEYKAQLAVVSCQVTELKRYYSMERHVRKQLQAKLTEGQYSHHDRNMEGRGMEPRGISVGLGPSFGATLAASHGEQTAPPTPSTYVDYSEYRQY